jgi:hypothetical protein
MCNFHDIVLLEEASYSTLAFGGGPDYAQFNDQARRPSSSSFPCRCNLSYVPLHILSYKRRPTQFPMNFILPLHIRASSVAGNAFDCPISGPYPQQRRFEKLWLGLLQLRASLLRRSTLT